MRCVGELCTYETGVCVCVCVGMMGNKTDLP
jgi:hypothetical protein